MPTRRVDTRLIILGYTQAQSIGLYSTFLDYPHPGTLNKISGWEWDQRRWASKEEIQGLALAPTLWDAESTGLDDDFFQSGIGYGQDVMTVDIEHKPLDNNLRGWVPTVNFGNYFVNQHPWFLYSDWALYLTMETANVSASKQYIDLPLLSLATVPITVARYRFDQNENAYVVHSLFEPVLEEDVDANELQYFLDTSVSPTRLWLSSVFNQELGGAYSAPGGILDLGSVAEWELLGYSGGQPWETFRSIYAPIDGTETIQVLTYNALDQFIEWTVLAEGDEFSGANTEVKINLQKGLIEFGNHDGSSGDGLIPPAGHHILLRYTPSIAVIYEPHFSQHTIEAFSADVNPMNNNINAGFIQITRAEPEPYNIVLDVVDLEPDGDTYFPLTMGGNYLRLVATVTDRIGTPLQNILVTFNNLPPYAGSFGNKHSITAITDGEGKAYAVFSAPLMAQDMAKVATIVGAPGYSTATVENLVIPGSTLYYENVYIYAVYNDDPVLGMPGDITTPGSALYQTYTDFLAEEGIVSGVTADEFWEAQHRALNNLLVPFSADDLDFFTGHKRLLITDNKAYAVNVHGTTWPDPAAEFSTNIFVPLHPYDHNTVVGEDGLLTITLDYDVEIQEPDPGVNHIKSYLVIADTLSSVQATAQSRNSNRVIESNIIGIKIQISEAASGTLVGDLDEVVHGTLTRAWFLDFFSDTDIGLTSTYGTLTTQWENERLYVEGVPETYVEWFRRTKLYDTLLFVGLAAWNPHAWEPAANPFYEGLPIVTYDLDGFAELPIGFRIRSTGITLASALDQVLYIEPNDYMGT